MRLLKTLWKSLLDFSRDDGMLLAGSLSYFTMMALVPFCLFMMSLFGYFIGHYPEFHRFFLSKLVSVFPSVTSGITRQIPKLTGYGNLGKFTILLYGFLSYQVFSSLENSLNVIFRVRNRRNIFASVLLSFVLVTAIIAILIVTFAAASAVPLLNELRPLFPDIRIGRATGLIIGVLLPFMIVLFTMTMVYKMLPRTRVKLGNAFRGALFTTVFLEIAKHLFTWYVLSFGQFGSLYGPLTAIVVFLLWMYYSACIFLVGAEIVHNLGGSGRRKGEK